MCKNDLKAVYNSCRCNRFGKYALGAWWQPNCGNVRTKSELLERHNREHGTEWNSRTVEGYATSYSKLLSPDISGDKWRLSPSTVGHLCKGVEDPGIIEQLVQAKLNGATVEDARRQILDAPTLLLTKNCYRRIYPTISGDCYRYRSVAISGNFHLELLNKVR